VIADALGNPVAISLTAGQASDLGQAEPLLEEVGPKAFLADKAYDADALIDHLNTRQITPVIPSKANRIEQRQTDFVLYCERNLIERFFNNLKHFRAIATRYDKLASTFLGAVHLVAAFITLN
jgi:transposase